MKQKKNGLTNALNYLQIYTCTFKYLILLLPVLDGVSGTCHLNRRQNRASNIFVWAFHKGFMFSFLICVWI